VPTEMAEERARRVQETQDRLAWERHAALLGSVHEVLVDGPSQDPAFLWEGRTAAQAPEIDGVVYLRDRSLTPGLRVPVEIVEVEGYDLVGTLARR
jgi:ribosomal protein S12 methylthiotransferase